MDSDASESDNCDDEWKQTWDPDTDPSQQSSGPVPTIFHESKSDVTASSLPLPKNKDESTIVSRMQLNDNKAGMEGLDKEKINAIIYEASKGSKYYENEQKKQALMNRRVFEQKQKLKSLSEEGISQAKSLADELLEELEKSRDLSHSIIHIDMDAFYAAVEMRDRPNLKNKPMAVGGNSMLCTSNYVARKYGVRAAMPGFIGKKLCPQLVIVPTNFEKYTAVSKQIRGIMAEYDPNFCPMSLDEAYLNMTEHVRNREQLSEMERSFPQVQDAENCVCRRRSDTETASPTCSECGVLLSTCGELLTFGLGVEEAVREMRHRIHLQTRLTASAGIAPNTMLAKVCSDKNKPNGQYRVNPDRAEVMDFVKDLPIRKVSGVGKVSDQMLATLGVVTCADLYVHRGVIYHLYSSISFNYFMRITLGLGSTHVSSDGERKSVSTERTFSEISRPDELYKKCEQLCESLTEDIQGQEPLLGKTVTLKLKTVEFEVKTRAQTLADYTCDGQVICEAARELLRIEIQACHPQPLRLRLMGVRLSNLAKESEIGKKRQNTITAFLKKHPSPQKSPRKVSMEQLSAPDTQNTGGPSPQKTKKSSLLDMFSNMSQKPAASSSETESKGLSACNVMDTEQRNKGSPNKEKNDGMGSLKMESVKSTKKSQNKANNSSILGMFNKMSHDSNSKSNGDKPCISDKTNAEGSEDTENSVNGIGDLDAKDNDCCSSFCDTNNTNSDNLSKGSNLVKSTPKRKSIESVDCPVCNRLIKSSSMKVITEHIEYCLLKQTGGRSSKESDTGGIAADDLNGGINTEDTQDSGEVDVQNEGSVNKDDLSEILIHEKQNTETMEMASIELGKHNLSIVGETPTEKDMSENMCDLIKNDKSENGMVKKSDKAVVYSNIDSTERSEITFTSAGKMSVFNSSRAVSKQQLIQNNVCVESSTIVTERDNRMAEQPVCGIDITKDTTDTLSDVVTCTDVLASAKYQTEGDGYSLDRHLDQRKEQIEDISSVIDSYVLPANVTQENSDNIDIVAKATLASGDKIQKLPSSSREVKNGNSDANNERFFSKESPPLLKDNQPCNVNMTEDTSAIPGRSGDMTEYICPICNILQDHPHLASFNKHVDNCLSRQTIREMLRGPGGETTGANGGGGSGASWMGASPTTSTHKRSPSVSKGKDTQSHKRRKLDKGLQTLEGFIKSRNS